MDVQTILEESGLSRQETKLYLAALQIGSAKIKDLAKNASVLRTTAYELFQSLSLKGLVSISIRSGVRYIEAVPPQRLKMLLLEKLQNVEGVIPELQKMMASRKERPIVELYEGKEGLKTILENILKNAHEFWAFANYDLFRILEFYFPKFVKKRIEKRIFVRVIQEKTPQLLRAYKTDAKEFREMRFLERKFDSTVFIYNDTVAFLTVTKEEPFGVLIRNKETADTQRYIFKMVWDLAKP